MFTLLNPSALLALLGLLVPVAIHLWNRRPGREVAVGSLRWLAAGANRRLRNLKPEQLWLLLLRAALLAVLAVALATPVWRQRLPGGRGQVLLSPELLGTPAFNVLRPKIDSLRKRGYALRWLAPGFAKVPLSAWRADSAGAENIGAALPAPTSKQPINGLHWARVREAAGVFAGQPLYVVTTNKLRDVQGVHPPLPAAITWQTVPDNAAESWLQAAAFRGDSLRLLLGRSTESQTTFRQVAVAPPEPGGTVRVAGEPALRFVEDAKKSRLQPLGPEGNKNEKTLDSVLIGVQPLRVIIYSTAAYGPDARYLQAALRAAAVGLPTALKISVTTTPPQPATPSDWLFWLSDAPLPGAWVEAVRNGTQVWQEAPGPGIATQATLVVEEADGVPISIYRRANTRPAPGKLADGWPIWTDGYGRAVLTRRRFERGAFYQLHTRLHPAWSEIADSPVLPARLLALLQPDLANEALRTAAVHDQRALDPMQFASSGSLPGQAGATAVASPTFRLTDLRPWLVLAAGVLLLLERLLARRSNQAISPLL